MKLVNENEGDELVARRKKKQETCQRSADSFRTPQFVRKVRHLAKHLQVSKGMSFIKISSTNHAFLDEVMVRHVMTPQFFPQGLRVNADADANARVETLQIIVVKPP
ncbi:hypothetical protein ACTXT7_013544 [Hymenolepis weldensis]